jgi:thymidylate synthase
MNIPVINIQAKTIAEAYEAALKAVYHQGIRIKTQYDKPGDPLSIDATMNLTILEPWTDPMIHKNFPGGFSDLREYVFELQGAKDNWIKNIDDPKDTKWEYTYHGRLAHYGQYKASNELRGNNINQIESVISKLVANPFTRQAQMITWDPSLDSDCYDPPCLQSIWYRLTETNGEYYLNCNIRFRSNDCFGASFFNIFGFTIFNREIVADEIQKRTGKKVNLGRLNWQADSFHVYGKDVQSLENLIINNDNPFETRTYNFHAPEIQEMYVMDDQIIKDKIEETSRNFQ